MVDIAVHGQILVYMAIQTIGRVGTQGYGVNDFLSWAVMAGSAGTGPVSGNIMLGAFDFRPVRHNMTFAAKSARRIIGKVTGTQYNRMGMSCVRIIPRIYMTSGAVTRCSFACCKAGQGAGGGIMTAGAVVMHLGIKIIGEWRRITVAAAAGRAADGDDP